MRLLAATLLVGLLALPTTVRADETADFLNKEHWDGLLEYWKIEGTTITGKTEKGLTFNTFLCSKKKYQDFEITFKVRLVKSIGNSGLQVRSEIADPKKFSVKGPQCDIGKNYWGSLYGELFGGMMKEAPKDKINEKLKEDDFNEYSIRVEGKHCTIKVNGVVGVDQDFEKLPAEGILAFQLHAGPPMEIIFKDISFKMLKK